MRLVSAFLLLMMAIARTGRPSAPPTTWYRHVRVLDVTGDGALDSLILVAQGTRSDSLSILLTVRVGGHTALEEGWSSSYMLIDPPDEVRSSVAARD